MGRKGTYTVTEVTQKPSLFRTALPFDITNNGRVVATVVEPKQAEWRKCEKCGNNTMNIVQFNNEYGKWQTLILCEKCSDEEL